MENLMDRIKCVFHKDTHIVVLKLDKNAIYAKRDKDGNLIQEIGGQTADGINYKMKIGVNQKEKFNPQKLSIENGNIFYMGYKVLLESPYFRTNIMRSGDENRINFIKDFYNLDVEDIIDFPNFHKNYEMEMFMNFLKNFKNMIVNNSDFKIIEGSRDKILEAKPSIIRPSYCKVVDKGFNEEINNTSRIILDPVVKTVEFRSMINHNIIFLLDALYEKQFVNVNF